jgi:hypothetical protein
MRCQSDLLRAPLQMVAIGGLESGLLRNNNTSQRRWPGSEDTTGGSEDSEGEQEQRRQSRRRSHTCSRSPVATIHRQRPLSKATAMTCSTTS